MPVTAITPVVHEAVKALAPEQLPKTGLAGGSRFEQVLHNQQQLDPIQKLEQPELAKTQRVPSSIETLFKQWNQRSDAMDQVVQVAINGYDFTPSQLILLQQATYKVTFELETMSKLVEQASSAVKTTMQTQV